LSFGPSSANSFMFGSGGHIITVDAGALSQIARIVRGLMVVQVSTLRRMIARLYEMMLALEEICRDCWFSISMEHC
jgi:hypothetical protein